MSENKNIDEKIINELLDQATHLICTKTPSTQADLRRAVSSSYYALFHFLIIKAVNHHCINLPLNLKVKICRTFQHGEMAEICRDLIKEIQFYEDEYEIYLTKLKQDQENITKSNGKYEGKSINFESGKMKYMDFLKFPVHENFKKILLDFPQMQHSRHEADYNLGVELDILDTQAKVTQVSEMIQIWRQIDLDDDEQNKNMFLMLLLAKKLRFNN